MGLCATDILVLEIIFLPDHKLILGINSQSPSKMGLQATSSNLLENMDLTPVVKYMWPELYEEINNGTQNTTNVNRRDSVK